MSETYEIVAIRYYTGNVTEDPTIKLLVLLEMTAEPEIRIHTTIQF